MHDGITFIGEAEFVLPKKLESLGNEVFMTCEGLSRIVYRNSVNKKRAGRKVKVT